MLDFRGRVGALHLPAASSRGTKFVDLLLRRQFEHVVGSLLDYLKL